MNGLERVRAAMRGDTVDRLPTFPISIASSCEITGTRQGDYSLDPACMADTLLEFRQLTGYDGIYVSRDNWIYHQSLGGEMIFPEDDEPYSTSTVLKRLEDFRSLVPPDPWQAPGMRTVLQAAEQVFSAAGREYYIQANIDTGPFSMAAVLLGLENFMIALMDESAHGLIDEFLAFCTETVIAYAGAMIETGVHGIQFGDASASLVGEDLFSRFALPWEAEVARFFEGRDCDLWIHICGRTDQFLSRLNSIPFRGFEVDALVPMTKARELLDEQIALKGNLDTTLLLNSSPEEVYSETRRIIDSGGFKTGIVVSPGCGVPRMTPLENLIAIRRACEDAGTRMV